MQDYIHLLNVASYSCRQLQLTTNTFYYKLHIEGAEYFQGDNILQKMIHIVTSLKRKQNKSIR